MVKRSSEPEGALYVRLPAQAVDKLDRAAHALGVHKKDLVAGLVTRYVDPDSPRGLEALGALGSSGASAPVGAQPRRGAIELGGAGPTLGAYSFQPAEPLEVLTALQAGALLQLAEAVVIELAETGELPGRKLGGQWRFARTAIIAWLSSPEAAR